LKIYSFTKKTLNIYSNMNSARR